MTILDEIFTDKRAEIAASQAVRPLAAVRTEAEAAPPPLDFIAALRSAPLCPALIAEIKFASPSRGQLVANPDPLKLARIYQQNGAAAISVLTDEKYFKGSLDYLRQVATLQPRLPVLRKDFICDPYQVYEARAAGADAILLITASLDLPLLRDLQALAYSLGMAALVETHDEAEVEKALQCDPALLGVNNRDLRDFTITLETCLRLRPLVPQGVCFVAESGIHTPTDVARLKAAGVDAMLIGEALVRARDIAGKLRELVRSKT